MGELVESGDEEPKFPGDALRAYLDSPAYKHRIEFEGRIATVPDFGIMHLSLLDAGDLVAADMWLSGDTEIEVPDSDNVSRTDPLLLAALAEIRASITKQLVNSVEANRLKPSWLCRDLLSGAVLPQKTFISFDSVFLAAGV